MASLKVGIGRKTLKCVLSLVLLVFCFFFGCFFVSVFLFVDFLFVVVSSAVVSAMDCSVMYFHVLHHRGDLRLTHSCSNYPLADYLSHWHLVRYCGSGGGRIRFCK